MRISTGMMYEAGAQRLSKLQTSMLKTQQMISAKRRILTPADDPTASARVLEVTQSRTINKQYAENRTIATSSLKREETVLGSVGDIIQDVQTRIVEAGDSAYSDDQRSYIADALRGQLEELLGLANTKDNEGNYMFSGYRTANQAFSSTASGVLYNGDQGSRDLQVANVRKIPISDSGDKVFMRVATNALYESGAAVSNTGTATVSSLSVADVTQLTQHDYNVAYDYTSNQFTITDLTLGTSSSVAYSGDPQTLTFDGLRMTVSGTIADGDTFLVRQVMAEDAQSVLVQNSNGLFVTAAQSGNTGTATVSPYFVTDTSLATGHAYDISYDAGAGVFHITDLTSGPLADVAYTGGTSQTLSFDGVQISINAADTMSDGDTFTIRQSTATQDAYFVSGASGTNLGTGSVSPLVVADAAQVTGHEYQVTYDDIAGNFDIMDITTGTPLASIAYTGDPQTITFDGLQLTISGTLADGDAFTVRQALEAGTSPAIIENGTESIFSMMENLIALLETPASTPESREQLVNGLALANANFSNALDHILTAQATVGARLNELESLDVQGENSDLLHAQTLSDLQDLDYTKAISDLAMQKTTLDAAQQSYVKIMNLSLFAYL